MANAAVQPEVALVRDLDHAFHLLREARRGRLALSAPHTWAR